MSSNELVGLEPFSSAASLATLISELRSDLLEPLDKLGMIEGQIGGLPPYDEDELRESGFAEMVNVNWRGAKQKCVRAANKTSDLILSRSTAVDVKLTKVPEAYASVQPVMEASLAAALTAYLRSPCIGDLRVQRIWECTTKGVGFAYFADKECPVPMILPRSGVLVPPDASSNVDSWTFCAVKVAMRADEVLRILGHPEDDDGWNRAELTRAFAWASEGSDKTASEFTQEKAEACVQSRRNGVWDEDFTLNLYRVYTRDKDGKIAEYAVADEFEHHKAFLFKSKPEGRFNRMSEVLFPLRYSKFHRQYWDIEGLGHDVYDMEGLADRTKSGFTDLVDLAMRPVVTHPEGEIPGRNSMLHVDRFIHLPAGQEVNGDIIKGDGGMLLGLNRMIEAHGESFVDRTALDSSAMGASQQPISAAEAKLESIGYTEQNTVSATFFYYQEDQFVQELVRRALTYDRSPVAKLLAEEKYPELVELHDALRELPRYSDMKVTHDGAVKVRVARAIGAGSQRDRRTSLQVGFQYRGALSPVGARAITQDFYFELFGDAAEKYVKGYDEDVFPSEEGHHPRYENAFFSLGGTVEVAVDDNHEFHLQLHTPPLRQAVQAGVQAEQQGQDPSRVLAFLQAATPHYARHVDLFQLQANTEDLAARHKQYLQIIGEATNYMQRLVKNVTMAREAQARQQAQAQAAQQKQALDQAKAVEEARLNAAEAKDESRRKDRVARADIRRKDQVAQAGVRIKQTQARGEAV